MSALFRTSRLDPRVVPTCEVELIEGHPLALPAGLKILLVPGLWGFQPFLGNLPALTNQNCALSGSSYGPALVSTAEGACAFISQGNATLVKPLFGASSTWFFAGDYLGAPTGANTRYFATAFGSQRARFSIGATTAGEFLIEWQNASFSPQSLTGSSLGGRVALAATFQNNIGISGYINGQPDTSQEIAYSINTYEEGLYFCGSSAAATFTNVAGAIGAAYDAVLDIGRVAWLSAEPFAMLRPVVRRTYVTVASGPSSGLSGSAVAASSATGELVGTGALAGTSAGAAAALGAIAGEGALSGAAAAVGSASAAIEGAGVVAGDSTATASAASTLVGIGILAGTAAATATAAGIPVAPGSGAMAGAAVATAAATGALIGRGALASAAEAASAASGVITATGAMSASAVAAAAASGTLAGFGPISGVAEATAGASGMPIGTTPPHVVSNSHGVRSAPTIRSVRSAPTIRSVI